MCRVLLMLAALVAASAQVLAFPQVLTDGEIDPFSFEQVVKDAVEGILGAIPDPLTVDSLEITLPEGLPLGLGGSVSLSELVASGISVHNISGAGIFPGEGMAIKFTVKCERLLLKTKYTADITALIFQILGGGGDIDIELKGATVSVIVQTDLNFGTQLKNLSILISLDHGSKADVTGLVFLGEPQEGTLQLLTDDIVDYINGNQQAISDIISPIIQDILNSVLPHTTTTAHTTTTTTGPTTTTTTTTTPSPGGDDDDPGNTTPKPNFGVVPVVVPLGLLVILSIGLGLF